MDIINAVLTAFFNLIFIPFKHLDPVWPMLAISFVTGILMLFVFKATSDQKGIKRAKNLVKGHFLAIRLYKDDISLMFDTMKNILLSNLLYMKQSLRPMLFLLIPMGIVLIQIGARYEHRPLRIGESTVLSLKLNDDVQLDQVRLDLPAGLSLEIPPVRVDAKKEISWRIKANVSGVFTLAFKYHGQVVDKQLAVIDELVPLSAEIAGNNLGVTVMNPNERSLTEASFASLVSVVYPAREFEFLGMETHWLVAFFVFSMVAAFSFKGILGVEV